MTYCTCRSTSRPRPRYAHAHAGNLKSSSGINSFIHSVIQGIYVAPVEDFYSKSALVTLPVLCAGLLANEFSVLMTFNIISIGVDGASLRHST